MPFEKLADFIMKNAKLIVTIWIVALLISVPFLAKSSSVLQYDMGNMKTSTPLESVKGQELLASEEFNSGAGIGGGTIIIIEAYDSLAPEIAPVIKNNLDQNVYFWDHNKELRDNYGMQYEVTIKQLGRFDDKYFADKETQMIVYTVNYPDLPEGVSYKTTDFVPQIRTIVSDSVASVDGVVKTYVTGTDAISYDTSTGFTKDIKHIDPISVLLVLILIGLFFRSFVTAGTPPVIIGMAYGVLLALVYAIGSVLGIYYITTILVLVSMLGAGCDYCIFIVSRYREERKEGKDHDSALRESIIWAGESIITSGISVIIGFGSLMLCSFSLVSTMGLVLALGIVLALLAALTFIPSLLMLVGDRIFWPSKVKDYKDGSKVMGGWYGKCAALGHRYFTHSAKSAIKYAKVIFAVTILISVPLVYVAATSSPSYDMIGAMPDGEAKDGVSIISENIGGGLLMPTNISMKVDAFVDLNVNYEIASGDVVPRGEAGIIPGSTVQLLAEPHPGCYVKGWIVNDKYYDTSDGNVTLSADRKTCLINDICEEQRVTVIYSDTSFNISFASDDPANGTVTAKANNSTIVSGYNVDYGTKLTFTATPKENYHVDYWVIDRDGTPETVYSHDTELSIDRASYNYDVMAYFVADSSATHRLDYTTSDHGSLSVRADDVLINSGDKAADRSHIVMSAIADEGYEVSKWVINGIETVTDSAVMTIDFLTGDTIVGVTFVQIPQQTYSVSFANDGEGTVTATANGSAITSGQEVSAKSKVVFTATPAEGKKVLGWKYKVDILGIEYYVTSYVSKNEHVITSLGSVEDVTVIFGTPESTAINVNTGIPSHGSIYIMKNGSPVDPGQFLKGDDFSFTAVVDEGYHITKWTVNGTPVETTSTNLTLYDLKENTTVTYETEEDDFVAIIYNANDENMGSLTVTCLETSIAYSERPNAINVYRQLNEFSQNLMAMETDGKKNVAIALGPVNGDIIFDGEHEWIFDTVWGILPQQYKDLIGTGETYDALVYLWSVMPYEAKQTINWYLTYKFGFVSDVFTDYEGGPEYQYVKVMVVTKEEPMSALSVDTIKQVYTERDKFMEKNSVDNGGFAYEAYISGAAVSNYEMSELVNTDFHFIIFIVIALLIILLFLVMNSYLTPVRAVLTIVMSVLWTLGLTYLLFGHVLNMPVVWIVPIVLFVVCLGLGMDYDILLTTRIKEYVSKGYSNDDAIIAAVQKSGAVITLCGLIMAGAFGTMMMSTSPMLKEFGFALGFAIAVDALIIRTYIVPAIMHLMGDWNWKGPNLGMIRERVLKRITDDSAAAESENDE